MVEPPTLADRRLVRRFPESPDRLLRYGLPTEKFAHRYADGAYRWAERRAGGLPVELQSKWRRGDLRDTRRTPEAAPVPRSAGSRSGPSRKAPPGRTPVSRSAAARGVTGAVRCGSLFRRPAPEAAILLFRIHDVLHDIADELSESNDRPAELAGVVGPEQGAAVALLSGAMTARRWQGERTCPGCQACSVPAPTVVAQGCDQRCREVETRDFQVRLTVCLASGYWRMVLDSSGKLPPDSVPARVIS